MFNLSSLFHAKSEESSFLNRLTISERQHDELLAARKSIRERLRIGVKTFSSTEEGGGHEITPKFYTQGSWAYKTVNNPAKVPPQQVDYDDGMYLPMSYLENNRPAVAAKVFFALVDNLLTTLCKERGWQLDKSKKTCSRIIVSQTAHVDIPLYSIPDEEFSSLVEKAAERGYRTVADSAVEFSEAEWSEIASDKVLLAMRDGDWEPSDPRKLHDWFIREVQLRGEQLRRVCRYLKAWRDYNWDKGGPSSIFLMACVVETFKNIENREDLSLLHVLELLPERLSEQVKNPVDDSEVLSDRIAREDLDLLITRSRQFAADLSHSVYDAQSSEEACRFVRKHLGLRFPLVTSLSDKDTKEAILAIPASRTSSSVIPKRTQAG